MGLAGGDLKELGEGRAGKALLDPEQGKGMASFHFSQPGFYERTEEITRIMFLCVLWLRS